MSMDPAARGRFYLNRIRQFSALLLHHFVKDGGVQNTAALTYTTLLSLVPLMTVMLALFSVFPASERVAVEIEDFVFKNFVPAAGEVVHEHLSNFSSKAAKLSGVGFVFLLVVALMLMGNIDKAFNTIWHVRKKRGAMSTFIVYWAILSLGPVLIVVSVGVTSYLVSIPILNDDETVQQLRSRFLSMSPVLISAFAFTLLYAVVPNRKVSLRHALAGGILAALLFESAKRGFALYVTHFPTYEAIYGAMAVIPIFLIWIYLSWLVTLLGAEFTYCLGIFRDDWHERLNTRGSNFLLALRLIGHLREAQMLGEQRSCQDLSKREPEVSEEHLEASLYILQGAKLVLRTEEKNWALARNLQEVKLSDLYRAAPFVLPDADKLDEGSVVLSSILQTLERDIEKGMNCPLEALYRQV
ncbi:MAG: virulence factor BrkB family protein [gamma proteobacterium endosymbiont of Lamellibrachia anaximandri]|nr:virulence factor BrkB family protein [gamma proteobacterium endosymbiont of Lamellibrachia anaximandri]MBL3617071.1 virulence factor BrkB family protein [gamma proteobacterium endosymbiont of Lamellibrachia anaximandri]